MKTEEDVVWDAKFNDSVTTYWLLNGGLICVVTVVGILFLPIWIIVGKYFTRKYLDSHQCTLTTRTLEVKKGIFTQVEKTVPLDRITDVGILQGPIMRYLNIESLSVETAGQSSVGSLIRLSGIEDGREFRDAILAQRDLVVGSVEDKNSDLASPIKASVAESNETIKLLTEIRDHLASLDHKT